MVALIWLLCVIFFLVLLRRNHLLDMATATHPSNLELEAKLDALLNAELDDATGFACVPDTLVKELEQFTAAIPREWTPKPTSQVLSLSPIRQGKGLHERKKFST